MTMPQQIRVEMLPLDEVVRWPRNPKLHDADALGDSVSRFGFVQPLLIDEGTGKLIAGHGRLDTLQKMHAAGKAPPTNITAKDGKWLVPVLRGVAFKNEQEAEAYLLADNRLVEAGGWDPKGLSEILSSMVDNKTEFTGIGFTENDLTNLLVELEGNRSITNNKLSDQFLIPPFSVLDARAGYWQERKRQWIALGIRSELGRGDNLLKFSDTVRLPLKRLTFVPGERAAQDFVSLQMLSKKRTPGKEGRLTWAPGNRVPMDEVPRKILREGRKSGSPKDARYNPNAHLPEDKQRALGVYSAPGGSIDRAQGTIGTSIFDPVLCELTYRWWCPKDGVVLDPFAGGSVRGVVAAWLGHPLRRHRPVQAADRRQQRAVEGARAHRALQALQARVAARRRAQHREARQGREGRLHPLVPALLRP